MDIDYVMYGSHQLFSRKRDEQERFDGEVTFERFRGPLRVTKVTPLEQINETNSP